MQPIEFYLNPSKKTRYFFHLVSIFAFLYVISWPHHFVWKSLLIAVIFYEWQKNVKNYGKKPGKTMVFRIWQDSQNRWGYENNLGLGGIGLLKGDSFKSSFFIILRIKTKTKIQTIFIPRDCLSEMEYRVLCSRISNGIKRPSNINIKFKGTKKVQEI